MRKRTLPLAVLATAALGLTACAGGGSGSGDVSADGQTLTVWIMQGTNPDSEAFFKEVGSAFKKETGATLKVEYVQWADAHDRFVTSIAGNTTPDVAETGTTWTAEFADAGALAPIGDYVDKAGLKDDLVQGLADSGTYDGELYGMPWYAGVRSIVYRTDVFEELGLKAPTTWQEIIDAGTAIKAAKPDMIPFPVPGDAEFTAYPWVWGAGGEVSELDGDTWKSGLASDDSRKGIQFWTDLATKYDLSSSGATTWKETDVLDNFVQDKVAMAIMGSWTPATIVQKNPELEGKFAAIPIPGEDGGMSPSVLGGSHLSMFNTSKNKDLAFQFIEMMTTGKFASEWAEQTGYFPGQTSLLSDSTESDDPLVKPFAEQFVDGGASLPVTPKFGAVQAKKTTNAMIQAILSGSKSVDQATTDAAKEMDDIMNGK
ncbi:sugar ABC transporter substrate-binding protein [Plantibacter sp. VKM Ac-2885]|jgi:N,N'-diacetylchitobiose transport system substrate-binding protein|uniref:Carbohydrate ABC transporter substrate-binding protein (CUT1 family) n=1 Tax=Plantibacter flavus TaxID=150123 RepID=A0A3N2BY54_9MICO|nr:MULTISPECIES: sugar ABC transporter substrate-binding protein [Plantibacter]MBD8519026.1 sugar ABC transporter substrate-binding protein [Plantibacter sp. CFBP 8804]MBD8536025.1 sugar ABC transporter substrate-binding protein [Plantibacter sp. CFBP 13570]MBF4513358.1 sugar ABC transporter substrate-binding protein [Plantibacter sp. VKM Ac-2885]MBF4565892.1 sugar ABC transporter substrate-binding protein [Plantibacter sp. VKM Ac-2876]ROR80179.1 carbohydrate ABC transporter substrate-binding 